MSFITNISRIKGFEEIKVLIPSVNKDRRGEIFTVIDEKLQRKILPGHLIFKHFKITKRKKNSLVGIHADNKTWKLFGCLSGRIFHNVSCIKKNNKNYLKNKSFILSEKNPKFILIPPNYGNSFYCFESSTMVYLLAYKGNYNDVENQITIAWNDKNLNIKWPDKNPILSSRDKNGIYLSNNINL